MTKRKRALGMAGLFMALLLFMGQSANNFGGPSLRVLGGPLCLKVAGKTLGPIAVNGPSSSNELIIETELPNYGGADTLGQQFNGDTGNNYKYAWQTRAIGGATTDCANQAVNTDRIKLGCADATTSRVVTVHILNIAGKYHSARIEGSTDTNSSATQTPFDQGTGGWSGTGVINKVLTFTSTNNMGAGTCTTVYGR